MSNDGASDSRVSLMILQRFTLVGDTKQLLDEIEAQRRAQPSAPSHNVGGWRSSDLLAWRTEGALWLVRELDRFVAERELALIKVWAIVNGPGASHNWHTHVSQSSYSGIVYLQDGGARARTLFAKAYDERKRRPIEPIEYVEPIPGSGVLFSSRTWHCVEAHTGPGQRITIAFDCR